MFPSDGRDKSIIPFYTAVRGSTPLIRIFTECSIGRISDTIPETAFNAVSEGARGSSTTVICSPAIQTDTNAPAPAVVPLR